MIKMKSLLALLFLIGAIHSVSAKEQTLATISNDENKNTYLLVVDTIDDGRTIKTFFKDVYQNGRKVSREALDYRSLLRSGLILEQRDKYVVMKLMSNDFDEHQGGMIVVDTLYNGANGTRKGYEVQLAQDRNGWALFNQGKVIKQIYIESNKVLMLGCVGIKNLLMK